MSIFASQFERGQVAVGTVVQGAGIGPDANAYEPLIGQTIVREARPRLSPLFPVGKMTGTVRTLAGNAAGPVVATADNFVAGNLSASANSIQYTADGATWSSTATPTCTPSVLLVTANRIIALNSAAAQGIVSATLVPTSTWSLMVSGPTGVALGNHYSRMAYSASLGRVLLGASTRFTLDDGTNTWVGRTSTSGLTSPVGYAWTGTRYVGIGTSSAICEFTADGITYTAGLLAEATSASQGNIASDGDGTVVVSGCPSGLQVSHDHGATWRIQLLTGVPPSDAWRIQRIGDRFVVPTAQGLVFSLDGRAWFLETTTLQSSLTTSGVAKKGTVTVEVSPGTTVAYSFTESATEFLLPAIRQTMPSLSGNPTPAPPYFVRAV